MAAAEASVAALEDAPLAAAAEEEEGEAEAGAHREVVEEEEVTPGPLISRGHHRRLPLRRAQEKRKSASMDSLQLFIFSSYLFSFKSC